MTVIPRSSYSNLMYILTPNSYMKTYRNKEIKNTKNLLINQKSCDNLCLAISFVARPCSVALGPKTFP